MDEKTSPNITSKETVGISPPEASQNTVQAMAVQSSKGPVGTPSLITNLQEYEKLYGIPTTDKQRGDSAVVSVLLSKGQPLLVTRYVEAATTVFASTEQPSPEQLSDFRVDAPNIVIENRQLSFRAVLVFATGTEVDITDDPDTQFSISDASYGSVSGGVFFPTGKLGHVTITIASQGNTVTHDVEVALLRVRNLELVGPSELTYGQQHQYRVIAHFIDDTSRDVTFDPETQWIEAGGDFINSTDGLIAGSTLSIPTVNTIRVVHKNADTPFTITINPTPFELLDAGESVFKLGVFPVSFSPTYNGSPLSHTIEWVVDKNTATILNNTSLDTAQLVMSATPDNSYEVTLYIDRGTVNEQSDTLFISRSALTQTRAMYSGLAGFRDIMAAQDRLGPAQSLEVFPDYVIGPQALELNDPSYPKATLSYAWNPQTERYDLAWTLAYNSFLYDIVTVDLQKLVGSQFWVTESTYSDGTNQVSVESGFWRLRIAFTPKQYQFPNGPRIVFSDVVLITGTDQTANLISQATTLVVSPPASGDVTNHVVEIPDRVKILQDDAYTSAFSAVPSTGDVAARSVIQKTRTVITAESKRAGTNAILNNKTDLTNWTVTQLTLT